MNDLRLHIQKADQRRLEDKFGAEVYVNPKRTSVRPLKLEAAIYVSIDIETGDISGL